MALVYEAGWDHSIIGNVTMSVTDNSGGPFAIDITTGTYAHTTMASVSLTSGFTDFASALTTAINASGTARTYSVSYSYTGTGPRYVISVNAGTTVLTFAATAAGIRMRSILGFSATTAAAASHTSNQRPRYAIAALQGADAAYNVVNVAGFSEYSDAYEGDGIAAYSEADSGASYMVSRTTAPLYADWSQVMEAKRSVYAYAAASTIPWTYQDLFAHCRDGNMPFMVKDDLANLVHVWRLRGDGVAWHPTREVADLDTLWRVPFRCVLQGRV